MGQDTNTNKPNITIGQANSHIEVDPEARANIYKPNQKDTSPK